MIHLLLLIGLLFLLPACATTAVAANTPEDDYDLNGNGTIEINELFDAIDDYFDGKITITVLFDVIDLYFGNQSGSPAASPTPSPTPTAPPPGPETGCTYYANLVDIVAGAMTGGDPPEHSLASYIAYYRDTHFTDDPQLGGAAEVLYRHLAAKHSRFYDRDAYAAATAARFIDRRCGAAGYKQATSYPSSLVEYDCATGALFAAVHENKQNPLLQHAAMPKCSHSHLEHHQHD